MQNLVLWFLARALVDLASCFWAAHRSMCAWSASFRQSSMVSFLLNSFAIAVQWKYRALYLFCMSAKVSSWWLVRASKSASWYQERVAMVWSFSARTESKLEINCRALSLGG